MRRLWGSVLLIGAAVAALACYNDSDTLTMEAEGLPEVVAVIAGRFDRNPDVYYEMRLERVTKELEDDLTLLASYDDAAVACDRLGRSDEGIAWMEKKWAVMESLGLADDHDARYRYWANIGTVRVHKWLQRGSSSDEVHLLIQAYDEIAQAVEIKPDAHFGREWVQLELMGNMLLNTLTEDKHYRFKIGHDENMGPLLTGEPDELRERRMEGLLGIVVLGRGWESEKIWEQTYVSVGHRHQLIRQLARMRMDEVAGKGLPQGKGKLNDAYRALRKNGEEYVRHREKFMLAKLEKGYHPDTHPNFWSGYEELPMISLAPYDEPPLPRWGNLPQALTLIAVIALPTAGLAVLLMRKLSSLRG